MTFFQVLFTNEFGNNSVNRQYTQVYNYPTLAKAMQCAQIFDVKGITDGITSTERFTDREFVQFHLNYVQNDGTACIEIRHEYLNDVEGCRTKQFSTQQAVYIREITL